MRRTCLVCAAFALLLVISTVYSLGQDTARKAGDSLALTIEGVKYAFRWCPAGEFMMGSPKGEANRNDDETQHAVVLSRGFWMLETEVTQEMWESVMGKNPSEFKGAKLPVETVSWKDCQEFVGGLNDLNVAPAGFKFALPTEAQWEYACRAGTKTAYYSGGALNAKLAHFEGRVTLEVGTFPANAWGLRDMHGNVWEWCLDGYGGDYANAPVTDPLNVSPDQSEYVCRSGSWYESAWFSRSASRKHEYSTRRDSNLGFRLAMVSSGSQAVSAKEDTVTPRQETGKDIIGCVEQFLRDAEWPGTKKEDAARDLVFIKVALADKPYDLFYLVKKKEDVLVVLAMLREKVEESHRNAVMEYLMRVNFSDLHIGNFQMDSSDGEIHFRVSIAVEHGGINTDIVKQLTGFAIGITDKYLPGIKETEDSTTR